MMNLSLFDLNTEAWSTRKYIHSLNYVLLIPFTAVLQGIKPSPRSRMSVSVNETTNIAWFYGGRSELTAQQTSYVKREIQSST